MRRAPSVPPELPGYASLGLLGSGGFADVFIVWAKDDHDEIRGLDDVDWALELGLGVGYEQRNYRLFADARYGAIGHHSWVGVVGADGIAYPVDGLTLTLGPRLEKPGTTTMGVR